MDNNNYEIVDNNGTIHTGTREEMSNLFSDYVNHMENTDNEYDSEYEYEGDLKLIQVLAVYR